MKGRISRIFYNAPGFTAGQLTTLKGHEVPFSCKFLLKLDDEVVVKGMWVEHKKYGEQFNVESFSYNQQLSTEGLVKYLVKHKLLKGIGPVKAQRIADAFGVEFNKVLFETPEKIVALGVPEATVSLLRTEWMSQRDCVQVFTELAALDISHGKIQKLIGAFGPSVLSMVRSDPYMLIDNLPGYGFKRADEIARKLKIPKDSPARISRGIMYLVQENENKEGHCWLSKKDLLYEANKLLIMDTLNSKDLIQKEYDGLIEKNKLVSPFSDVVSTVYAYKYEKFLYNAFKQVTENKRQFVSQISQLLYESPFKSLNEEQVQAVNNFVKFNQSVILGIGGSGKSYTLGCIVKLCRKLGLTYVLMAPTGKAAKVLQGIIGEDVYTIHRLLGYNGRTFERTNPLVRNSDVIILDETSMITTDLLYHLYINLDLTRQRVIFAGDFNQLPPIGLGNLAKNFTEHNILPKTLLLKCMRQAGELRINCNKILDGIVEKTSKENLGTSAVKPWYKITSFKEPQDIIKYIEELYNGTLSTKLGYNIKTDVQLLTPTNKTSLGVYELNKVIQKIVQKKYHRRDITIPGFYSGDKVINIRNNYDKDIMNGDVGFIKSVDLPDIVVDFDGREIVYNGQEEINDLMLFYVSTVHRTQGSQFPCVILICHKSMAFMGNRNLLYTGATRATQCCAIIGDSWGVKAFVNKFQENSKRTYIDLLVKNS